MSWKTNAYPFSSHKLCNILNCRADCHSSASHTLYKEVNGKVEKSVQTARLDPYKVDLSNSYATCTCYILCQLLHPWHGFVCSDFVSVSNLESQLVKYIDENPSMVGISIFNLIFLNDFNLSRVPLQVSIEPVSTFVTASLIFLVNLLVCDMSQTMSKQFEKLSDEVWNLDWYLFPIDMQGIILISMANRRQQAVAIEGFGNIQCSWETFK